jgi:hypothetical protein
LPLRRSPTVPPTVDAVRVALPVKLRPLGPVMLIAAD